VVATELGIKKNHDFDLEEKDTRMVKEAVRQACARFQPPRSVSTSQKRCCT
jgi:uncharacterized metal-binding protein